MVHRSGYAGDRNENDLAADGVPALHVVILVQ
jgi:hypothetical protein